MSDNTQNLYAKTHRRVNSNQIEFLQAQVPPPHHQRTFSNTATDFQLIFSGQTSPDPKLIKPQLSKKEMSPDSLSEQSFKINLTDNNNQFTSLLDAAITYFNSDSTPFKSNKFLQTECEFLKSQIEKLRIYVDKQADINQKLTEELNAQILESQLFKVKSKEEKKRSELAEKTLRKALDEMKEEKGGKESKRNQRSSLSSLTVYSRNQSVFYEGLDEYRVS